MGKMELESRKRTRRNQLKTIILSTVQTAGLIGIAVAAPNVLGAMAKLGLIPSSRQREVVNRSCDKLVRAGLMEWKNKKLRLTEKGKAALRSLRLRDYQIQKPRRWDRKWRVLIFDIPEYRKGLREKVRRTLIAIGFERVQDSVWAYPYDCEDLVELLKADFRVGHDILYMIVDVLQGDKSLRQKFGLK